MRNKVVIEITDVNEALRVYFDISLIPGSNLKVVVTVLGVLLACCVTVIILLIFYVNRRRAEGRLTR